MHLSKLPVGQLAFVNDIAVSNNIPKKFLDAILGELRNAGFVQSRKGKDGGYRLARPAADIKIGHVVRVLDGPLAPIPVPAARNISAARIATKPRAKSAT